MELVWMTGSFARTGTQALRRAGSMAVGDLGARYAGRFSWLSLSLVISVLVTRALSGCVCCACNSVPVILA